MSYLRLLCPAIIATTCMLITTPTQAVVLYDASLGTDMGSVFPAANQGWRLGLSPFLGTSSSVTTNTTHTLIDTSTVRSDKLGYFSEDPTGTIATPSIAPTLDASTGYTLRFKLRIVSESHTAANTRAGFSVIAVSSDTSKALELGFWTDTIFAYSDDGPDADNAPDFLPEESVNFDTTALNLTNNYITYDLAVLGSSYNLFADNTNILSGSLRDYSTFAGSPNPYAFDSFLFFGDDTSSADAITELAYVEVLPVAIPEPGTALLMLIATIPLYLYRRQSKQNI
ncbi:choice-of-anchor Y domain-containing protein [Poriferisphaera sp. WC338]|uniref:choice-of-anchor Y domain-containing protein n=1 Tax=Poriferisphaera sp. WC338 TaxID=3425129 RepID=UPI003D81A309